MRHNMACRVWPLPAFFACVFCLHRSRASSADLTCRRFLLAVSAFLSALDSAVAALQFQSAVPVGALFVTSMFYYCNSIFYQHLLPAFLALRFYPHFLPTFSTRTFCCLFWPSQRAAAVVPCHAKAAVPVEDRRCSRDRLRVICNLGFVVWD